MSARDIIGVRSGMTLWCCWPGYSFECLLVFRRSERTGEADRNGLLRVQSVSYDALCVQSSASRLENQWTQSWTRAFVRWVTLCWFFVGCRTDLYNRKLIWPQLETALFSGQISRLLLVYYSRVNTVFAVFNASIRLIGSSSSNSKCVRRGYCYCIFAV